MDQDILSQIERDDTLLRRVLQQITEAIITGRFKAGDKLVETQVGEQLGVSRGPVREAFRRLEQMGLVEKIAYRGTFVSELNQHDVIELHSIREPLEGLAARLLAQQRDPQAVAGLEAILQRMRQVDTISDRGRTVELDVAFHDALIEWSAHKLLHELWLNVSPRLHRFLVLKSRRLYRSPAEAAQIHEPIVRAIAVGDEEQAESEARYHVVQARQYLDVEDALALESS